MEHKHSGIPETQEIALQLEHYEDIFSDFDTRPYSKRALSVDFLEEIKRASRDKNDGPVELIFSVSKDERNESHDQTIRDRLSDHFHKHYGMLVVERRRILRLGLFMVLLGVVCMILATMIIFKDPTGNLWLSFLVVFLEPAAWFLLWEGMDQIIFETKSISHDLNFYRKMSDSHGHIHFHSY